MPPTRMRLSDLDARTNEISGHVLDAAVGVQKAIGPGLLERPYNEALAWALAKRGFVVEREVGLGIEYDGLRIPDAYRMDLWIERRVVVEIKAIERLTRDHEAQLLTYLRFSRSPLGILLNFNELPLARNGFRRIALSNV